MAQQKPSGTSESGSTVRRRIEKESKNGNNRPWLIAAWPGMANVALIAAAHLVEQLNMTGAGSLPPGPHFDVNEADVRDGLVQPSRIPQGLFFIWKNQSNGHDLVVFISESQPSSGSYTYAHTLLDEAVKQFGIERVITFASLASGLRPSENPKVSGVATDPKTLDELHRAEVEPLQSGQLGGLNGLLLGVAAERGMPGACLLAEIPFFAMRVPNPKAARAALSVFSILANIDISLDALNKQAKIVDTALIEAMEMMERQQQQQDSDEDEEDDSESQNGDPGKTESSSQNDNGSKNGQSDKTGSSHLSQTDREHLNELFERARKDPSQAVPLKTELDRLGVFKQYEGRFLDLFRRAG